MKTETTIVRDPMLAEVQLTYSARPDDHNYPILNNPEDVYGYLCDIWNQGKLELQEEFAIVLFNNALRVLGWSRVSSGGKSSTIVDVALVLQIALLANAHSVVIAHNHPSGTLHPSVSDINLTKRIKDSLNLMGISLNDHLIITRDRFYSFREHGLI